MKINNLNEENSNLNLKQKAKNLVKETEYDFSEDITNQNAIRANILNAAKHGKHKIKILIYKLYVEEGTYGFQGFDTVINLTDHSTHRQIVVQQLIDWLKTEGFDNEQDIHLATYKSEKESRDIVTVSW